MQAVSQQEDLRLVHGVAGYRRLRLGELVVVGDMYFREELHLVTKEVIQNTSFTQGSPVVVRGEYYTIFRRVT